MKLKLYDEIIIWKAQNWYIIKYEESDEELMDRNIVVQIDDEIDENEAEQKALQEVFQILQEFFWVYYSKHNKTNLVLSIDKSED